MVRICIAPGARRAAACACACALALAACVPASRGPEPGRTASPPAEAVQRPALAPDRADAAAYEVVTAASELRVLVYRGGPLARLGHNHVLVARDLRGVVHVPPDGTGVRFDMSFDVGALALDEPAARAAEGPEFASTPTSGDVDGTRRNLESPPVLDAGRYPRVTIRGLGASGGPDEWRVRAAVELRGAVHEVEVPARVERAGDRLVARGEFPLRQTAVGLTPFSVAMGALQVRDELRIRYVLAAERR